MTKMNKVTKHAGGRPTKYYPEIDVKIQEYIASTGREQTKLPTVEGLAIYLDITRETVYQWAKLYPVFSDTLKKIEILQKEQLMNDSFYGGKEVNAGAGVFLLKANHGMKDNEGNVNVQVNVTPILGQDFKLNVPDNNSNQQDS
jgi:hypothetical protein